MENKTSPLEKLAESGQDVGARPSDTSRPHSSGLTLTPRLRSPRRRGPSVPTPQPQERKVPAAVSLRHLRAYRDEWLDDGEVALHSPRTINARRDATSRLLSWLEERRETECGTPELRRYFVSVRNLRTGEALSIDTLDTYRRIFTAWWNWMKRAGLVAQNPMDGIPAIPAHKKKINQQVQPFGREQWQALLLAAAKSPFPRRDSALLHLLLDTGLRAGEVCSIEMKHIEMSARSIRIFGKGDKERTASAFYSALTSRFLWAYLRECGVEPEEMPEEFLFVACTGRNSGATRRAGHMGRRLETLQAVRHPRRQNGAA